MSQANTDLTTAKIVGNVLAFQALWWLCVLAGDWFNGWLVLTVVLVYALWYLGTIEGWSAALPSLVAALIGTLFDQIGYRLGLIEFVGHDHAYLPLWMFALWLAFATTLNVSLRWLQTKMYLAALLGAIFGPLAYWGAQALGAVVLPSPVPSLTWFAVEWGVLMPVLLRLRTL